MSKGKIPASHYRALSRAGMVWITLVIHGLDPHQRITEWDQEFIEGLLDSPIKNEGESQG